MLLPVFFPSIIPKISGGASTLSDILVLAVKEKLGKLKKNDGLKGGVTGDVATLTASGSKDMYLGQAQIKVFQDTTTGGGIVEIVLKMNGVEVERWAERIFAGEKPFPHKFINDGRKVTTGQIIKIEVITATSPVRVHGSLVCWE